MTRAKYGRMRVGRCARGDYGFIGCTSDVIKYMDQECTGNQQCQLSVPSLEDIAQPCPGDFKSYLEASYTCIKVSSGTEPECRKSKTIQLKGDVGYMSTSVTDHTSRFGMEYVYTPGTEHCPWTITVGPGRKVELVYFDLRPTGSGFGGGGGGSSDGSHVTSGGGSGKFAVAGCPLYAVISERGRNTELNLCDYTKREGHLFTSATNHITFYFISPLVHAEPPRFLVKYRGTGCADIKGSPNTWVKRDGDNVAIRCNQTQETWYVTCKGNQWIGDIGNCTKAERFRTPTASSSGTSLPHGILMAVVIGILLGVVIGTVLLALVFTCRRRRMASSPKPDPLLQVTQMGGDEIGTITRNGTLTKLRHNDKMAESTRDGNFRQQMRPLISRPTDSGGDYSTQTQTGTPTTCTVVPPPYTIDWRRAPREYDGTCGGGPTHEYATTIYDMRIPPVYFELDTGHQIECLQSADQ